MESSNVSGTTTEQFAKKLRALGVAQRLVASPLALIKLVQLVCESVFYQLLLWLPSFFVAVCPFDKIFLHTSDRIGPTRYDRFDDVSW